MSSDVPFVIGGSEHTAPLAWVLDVHRFGRHEDRGRLAGCSHRLPVRRSPRRRSLRVLVLFWFLRASSIARNVSTRIAMRGERSAATNVVKLPPIKETVGIFNKVEMCPEVRDQNLQYGAYYTSKWIP